MMDKATKNALKNIRDVVLWGAFGSLVVFFLIAVFFRVSPYSLVNVNGVSMAPTLANGDLLVMKKGGDPIVRDQIAVFYPSSEWEVGMAHSAEMKLIKRVVAVPGDTVIHNNSSFTIESSNGDKYSLPQSELIKCDLDNGESLKLTSDQYLLAGDNRGKSFDSFAAWCMGLDPVVSPQQIDLSGEVKIRLKDLGR